MLTRKTRFQEASHGNLEAIRFRRPPLRAGPHRPMPQPFVPADRQGPGSLATWPALHDPVRAAVRQSDGQGKGVGPDTQTRRPSDSPRLRRAAAVPRQALARRADDQGPLRADAEESPDRPGPQLLRQRPAGAIPRPGHAARRKAAEARGRRAKATVRSPAGTRSASRRCAGCRAWWPTATAT